MNKSFVYTGIKSLITFGILMFLCVPLFAQDEKKEEVEKTAARMSLSSTQINGDTILLQTAIKTRREGGLQSVPFEWVQFTMITDSITKQLGKALTDDKGVASLMIGVNQLQVGEDGLWMFASSYEGNDSINSGEADLSIRQAGMVLAGEEQDSVNVLTFRLYNPTDESPMVETEVKFYVKRHFSNLEIGEGTTDENGEVTIEVIKNLPGDMSGHLVLIAKAEDLDEYGSVSAVVVKPWGVAIATDDEKRARELWSHSPPLWMIITFIVLMTVVWGHYIVIIYNLVKIRNSKIQNP
jgi:hypothetical protein